VSFSRVFGAFASTAACQGIIYTPPLTLTLSPKLCSPHCGCVYCSSGVFVHSVGFYMYALVSWAIPRYSRCWVCLASVCIIIHILRQCFIVVRFYPSDHGLLLLLMFLVSAHLSDTLIQVLCSYIFIHQTADTYVDQLQSCRPEILYPQLVHDTPAPKQTSWKICCCLLKSDRTPTWPPSDWTTLIPVWSRTRRWYNKLIHLSAARWGRRLVARGRSTCCQYMISLRLVVPVEKAKWSIDPDVDQSAPSPL